MSVNDTLLSHLYRAEFSVNNLNHPLYLLGCDGSGPALLPQQVHHVGGELVAGLVVLLQLLVHGVTLVSLVTVTLPGGKLFVSD